MATEAQSRIEIEYCRHPRLWWESLHALVGDVTWDFLDASTQLTRAEVRGEYTYFSLLGNKVAPYRLYSRHPETEIHSPCAIGGEGGGVGWGVDIHTTSRVDQHQPNDTQSELSAGSQVHLVCAYVYVNIYIYTCTYTHIHIYAYVHMILAKSPAEK